jgi:HD superfamily phosphodiesterase
MISYSEEQKKLLRHVRQKVDALFAEYPVTAHGMEHVARVAVHAKDIAITEQARSVFLCELAGYLHDIGRVPEHYDATKKGERHHALSYEMLREWFREDTAFDILSEEEKLELLYAVKYHWNDAADQYDTAIILRDADKLDALGSFGVERSVAFYGTDKELEMGLRLCYAMIPWLRTDAAKARAKQMDAFEPLAKESRRLLAAQIEPVTL